MTLFESRTNTFENFFAMRDKVIPKHSAHKEKSPDQIKKAHMKTTIPMFADNVSRYRWVYKDLAPGKDCYLQSSYVKTNSAQDSLTVSSDQLWTGNQSATNNSTRLLQGVRSQERLLGHKPLHLGTPQSDFVEEKVNPIMKPSSMIASKRLAINRSQMNFRKPEITATREPESLKEDTSGWGLANCKSSPVLVRKNSPKGSKQKLNYFLQALPKSRLGREGAGLPQVKSPNQTHDSQWPDCMEADDLGSSKPRIRFAISPSKMMAVNKKYEGYPHIC